MIVILTTERRKNLQTNIKEIPTSRIINTERDSSHTFSMTPVPNIMVLGSTSISSLEFDLKFS